jgi:hypothetical protein
MVKPDGSVWASAANWIVPAGTYADTVPTTLAVGWDLITEGTGGFDSSQSGLVQFGYTVYNDQPFNVYVDHRAVKVLGVVQQLGFTQTSLPGGALAASITKPAGTTTINVNQTNSKPSSTAGVRLQVRCHGGNYLQFRDYDWGTGYNLSFSTSMSSLNSGACSSNQLQIGDMVNFITYPINSSGALLGGGQTSNNITL